MNPQLNYLFTATIVILLVILLWVVSIVVVYANVHKREVGGLETFFWLALTFLLPFVGFLMYWTIRFISRFLSPVDAPKGESKRRVTQMLRSLRDEPRKGTIPAAVLVREASSVPQSVDGLSDTAQQSVSAYKMLVLHGPCAGEEYPLSSFPASIGRGPAAAVRLDKDLSVSRQHAEIYDYQGVLRIRDLKSLHGTLINGFSVEDKSLEPGDRIEVGQSVLLLKSGRG